MKRRIILAKEQSDFDIVAELREDEKTFLDPSMYLSSSRAQPMRIEGVGVVYHLVTYTAEELQQIKEIEMELEHEKEAQKPQPINVQKVEWHKVNDLLEKGYVIVERWSKEALLYKYPDPEQPQEIKTKPRYLEPTQQ